MNKEALRKELEDAWKDGFNSSCDVMSSYIATRLAALDDGDGGKLVSVVKEIVNAIKDFEIPITLHQGKFPARTINLPESTFIRMKEALASVLLPEINSNVMEWDYCDECKKLVSGIARGTDEEYFQTECPECDSITTKIDVSELVKRIQSKPIDDGQEGKGLPKFLVIDNHENNYAIWTRGQYERYVSGALEIGGCPAVKVVSGFNGDEDFLFPALPVADGDKECPRCHGEGEVEKNIPGNEGAPEMDVMVGCPECGGTGIENP